jgi:hypothetical protein
MIRAGWQGVTHVPLVETEPTPCDLCRRDRQVAGRVAPRSGRHTAAPFRGTHAAGFLAFTIAPNTCSASSCVGVIEISPNPAARKLGLRSGPDPGSSASEAAGPAGLGGCHSWQATVGPRISGLDRCGSGRFQPLLGGGCDPGVRQQSRVHGPHRGARRPRASKQEEQLSARRE